MILSVALRTPYPGLLSPVLHGYLKAPVYFKGLHQTTHALMCLWFIPRLSDVPPPHSPSLTACGQHVDKISIHKTSGDSMHSSSYRRHLVARLHCRLNSRMDRGGGGEGRWSAFIALHGPRQARTAKRVWCLFPPRLCKRHTAPIRRPVSMAPCM